MNLSLSPIKPLDAHFSSSLINPPSYNPVPWSLLEVHGDTCLCCIHNRTIIFGLRDELQYMFSYIENLFHHPTPMNTTPPPMWNEKSSHPLYYQNWVIHRVIFTRRFNHITIPHIESSIVSPPLQLNSWRLNHLSWYTNPCLSLCRSLNQRVWRYLPLLVYEVCVVYEDSSERECSFLKIQVCCVWRFKWTGVLVLEDSSVLRMKIQVNGSARSWRFKCGVYEDSSERECSFLKIQVLSSHHHLNPVNFITKCVFSTF